MNSFTNEIHADEIAAVEPTAQDWAEYHAWLASQDESEDGDWVDDYADEYDGQPDEYTEWMDFDPDC